MRKALGRLLLGCRGMNQEPELQGAYYVVCTNILQGENCYMLQKKFKKKTVPYKSRREERRSTVTLFSVPGRNPSVAVSRNSIIGLSWVTHRIRSSLCSSNRADKVFPSPVLPGGKELETHKRSRSI